METLAFPFLIFMGDILWIGMVASRHPAYVGCYGNDIYVYKVPKYLPTQDCWNRCRGEGTRKVVVVGGRWCGCFKPMAPMEAPCDVQCNFIEPPLCVCFTGDPGNYYQAAQDAVKRFIANLPKPHNFAGYNCMDADRSQWKVTYPSENKDRMYKCLYSTCKGYKHCALLQSMRCGCPKELGVDDYMMVPITRECLDRVLCMDSESAACLAGNELVTANSYPSGRMGPLLNSVKFDCHGLKITNEYGRRVTKNLFHYVQARSSLPDECIKLCQHAGPFAAYAGISKGGTCACDRKHGEKRFPEIECSLPCSDPTIKGCGGEYAASLYVSGRVKSVTAMPIEEDLGGDVGGAVDVGGDEDGGGQLGISSDDVMTFGGVALGVIALAIIGICIYSAKRSGSGSKKKKKSKKKSKHKSPEEREARKKRVEERKKRRREKNEDT